MMSDAGRLGQRARARRGGAIRPRVPVVCLTAALGVAAACSDGSTGPNPSGEPQIRFTATALNLGPNRDGEVTLRNDGDGAGGPIEIRAGQVLDEADQPVFDARIDFSAASVATLNSGAQRTIGVAVVEVEPLPFGSYRATVTAYLDERAVDDIVVNFTVPQPPMAGGHVAIVSPPASARQGDVMAFSAAATDSAGNPIADPTLSWRVEPAGSGFATPDGRVVGYLPGAARVIVSFGTAEDTADVSVEARALSGSLAEIGAGPVPERYTSDLWVHGSHAYTGSWSTRTVDGQAATGNTLYAWNVASPTAPARTDSVRLDARVVNDVKVASDGSLAVASHEASTDGANGVTILDLADPAHPATIGRFVASELSPGVHNLWIDGSILYVVVDGGAPTSGLYVVDIADPAAPSILSHFYAGSSFLHDVLVRDGLAFLSHWNAGLVIVDVGNGVAGGTPASPVEVSRVELGGQTHNAWYWPAGGYVFVGEEDFGTPGIMHVVDVTSLHTPREVATFRVPGDTPHNFWLDETAEVLYLAWYGRGVRALDVSGELLGELDRQGREIASLESGPAGACPGAGATTATCTWAPQLHDGVLWLSDMHRGLLALQPSF
jgi:hypothetical protein